MIRERQVISDSMIVAVAAICTILIQQVALTLQLWIRAHYKFSNGHNKEDKEKKSDQ